MLALLGELHYTITQYMYLRSWYTYSTGEFVVAKARLLGYLWLPKLV